MTAAVSREILFVTGTRADFGKLEPLALAARKAGHQVSFFVTGMHMMSKYGLTKNEVHRSGDFKVIEFVNQRPGDPQDIVLSKTISGFSDYLQESRPDLIVVHGDRVEAIACCLVSAINYVRCAHVEGGEVSGTIDEVFRHCNTKLSTVHLVSSDTAKKRILRMGEAESSVHVIGSAELDIHATDTGVSIEQVIQRYDICSPDYGICVFHPVTSERASMGAQADALFDALEASGRYFVVIKPNNDPGSDQIEARIGKLPKDRFRVLPSMRFAYFSTLMKNAGVIVGNSSMGVREAPFIGIPSLDIGSRQTNRSDASSVYHCLATNRAEITAFLQKQWSKRYPPHKEFGEGTAADHFARLLDDEAFWSSPLQKSFVDSSTDG